MSLLLSLVLSLALTGTKETVSFSPLPSSFLPSDEVSSLYQDSAGFVWIVTSGGLARYDAYTTRVYQLSEEFSDRTPRRVIEYPAEGEKELLVGTDRGFLLLDTATGKVTSLGDPLTDNLNVNDILLDRQHGRLWVCGDKGLYYKGLEGGSVFTRLDLRTTSNPGLTDLIDILLDTQGNLWISSWHKGLYRYSIDEGRLYTYTDGALGDAYVLHMDMSGNLWVGTWGEGLLRIAAQDIYKENLRYTRYSHNTSGSSLPDDIIYDIDEDGQGQLLIGSRSGYSIMTGPGVFDNCYPDSKAGALPFNEVNAILRTQGGNIFLGLFGGGVCSVQSTPKGPKIMSLDPIRKELKTNSVKSLYPLSPQEWLLGIGGHGAVWYNTKTQEITSYLDSPVFKGVPYMSEVEKICSTKGKLLLATYARGLFCIEEKSGRLRLFNTANSILQSDCIRSIDIDSEGIAFLGTRAGAYRFNPVSEKLEAIEYGLSAEDLAVTDNGDLFLACGNEGLLKISKDGDRRFLRQNDNFICVEKDSQGRIWAGTSKNGLYLYTAQDEKFKRISELSFFPGQIIRNIACSSDGKIWVTTADRAISFNYNSLGIDNVHYHKLPTEGNATLQFNDNSFVELPSDSLMAFGTSHGIVLLDERESPSTNEQASLAITSFDTDKKSWPYISNISLPRNENSFTVSFSLLNYGNTYGNVYKYRLHRKGSHQNETWSIIGGDDNTAVFRNVKSGHYSFELYGASNGTSLDGNYCSFDINVRGNPWTSWWAISLYVLFVTALIAVITHEARSRLALKQKAEYEQFSAQKAEEVNQAKLRFFTDVSHEFLTPLSIILASAESLKPRSEEDRKILDVMSSNAIRLTRLVQQVLDFRKAENNSLSLRVSKGDAADFVGRCVEAFQPLVRKRGLTISYETAPRSIEAWFDPDKLDKIMYNLISNAVKYTPEGGEIKVHVEEKGSTLLIQVSNGGPLMSEKTRSKLFRRFYEGDFRKYSTLGNGIGLSLVKSLVDAHKGSISVESTPETGNLFSVRLPLHRESYSSDEIDSETIPETPLAFSMGESIIKDEHHTVLLADDNADVLSSFGAILSKSFNVRSCTNAQKAMEILRSGGADIVVADIMMPEVNGFELCKMIKGSVETSHIPVILLTGRQDEQSSIEGYSCGADGFLTKPCNFSVLTAMIRNLLRKQESKSADFRRQLVFEVKDIDYTSMDKKFLQQAIDVVNAHIADSEFEQNDFVDAMNVSRTVLTEKLKSLTGFTPMAFIVNARLTLAYKLLMEEEDKIRVSDLAYTVGFNDAKYFSKKFKAKFGKSPKEIIDEKNNR